MMCLLPQYNHAQPRLPLLKRPTLQAAMTVGAMAAHPHVVAAMAVEAVMAVAAAAGEPALQLHHRGCPVAGVPRQWDVWLAAWQLSEA